MSCLLCGGGRGGEVGGYGVEEGPGLGAQLHPVRGTLVVVLGHLGLHHLGLNLGLHLGLLLLSRPSTSTASRASARSGSCLHPLLEVRAGATRAPV